jgi:osmotically-inducible protein OsmY
VLSGTVPSYFLKQVAQEVVRRLESSACVENNVAVCPQMTGISDINLENRDVARQGPADAGWNDADLKSRVMNFLNDRQVPGSMAVDVDVQGSTVILRGSLPSDHARWLCRECCRRVAGVLHLIDQLKTDSRPEPSSVLSTIRRDFARS